MKKLLIFVAGVAVGSVATWKVLKDKYATMAQEEIDSVKERYSERVNKHDDSSDESDVKEEVYTDIYKTMASDYGSRTSYSAKYQPAEEKKDIKEVEVVKDNKKVDKPYVIPPEEFGELDGYETISLSYHADNVLTDDDYELVDDVDEVIGLESLTHFGEYEDDSVFVRNDRLKCDYEILLDHRKYSEIIEQMPYLMRD